jgi:hypothetical protein
MQGFSERMRGPAVSGSRLPGLACGLAIAGLLAASASACGSGSPPPLVLLQDQGKIAGCIPAPDPLAGIPRWDTEVGISLDWYLNQSAKPVTVESVSLLDPHNLVLHGAVVYEMAHSQHPLAPEAAWAREGADVPAAAWAGRQPVPGAVIAPGNGPPPVTARNPRDSIYAIVVDISAATPAGGWALGEVVTYLAGGHKYTIRARTGLGIGSSRAPIASACHAQVLAIEKAFGLPH